MRFVKQLVPVLLGFGVMVAMNGGASAARPKDVCLVAPTGGGGFNAFVLREVDALFPGGAVALRGIYTVTNSQRVAPVHGSAVMGSDGQIRIGFFVHSSADSTNDFTIAGVLDSNYNGTVNFDNDGDFKPNGTLDMQRVDCSTIIVP